MSGSGVWVGEWGEIKQIFVILILKKAACSDIMECINMNKV